LGSFGCSAGGLIMAGLKNIFFVVLICVIFILPVNITNSPETGSDGNEIENQDPVSASDSEVNNTRSSSSVRNNFQIVSSTPVLMPEVNASWIQDSWSGGPGQSLWSDPRKYDVSSNLNITSPEGYLEIKKSGFIETWEYLGDGSGGRSAHKMVWSPQNKVFYIFGGYDDSFARTNTLIEYDPAKNTWKEIGKTNPPDARTHTLMVWDDVNEAVWVYGGSAGSTRYLNDLWAYNPATDTWTEKKEGPGGRYYHAGAFNPNKAEIIVYGGYMGDWYNPSKEVYVYNIQSNTWTQKTPYLGRYYHDAVWASKTNSMMVFGGVEKYVSGVGYTYVKNVNEYFPNTDTWINRSTFGVWTRPIMGYDDSNEQLIVHSGRTATYTNETWLYDINADTWEQTLDGPEIRYDSDGDWDNVNDQFVVFAGRYATTFKDSWAYFPDVPAYGSSGELVSSVYDPGHKINPRSISFNASNLQRQGIGNFPVKIKIAGSDKSPGDATKFIGPNGQTTSYFSTDTGESIPVVLKGTRYLAYTVNLTTKNRIFSPEFERIKIDYWTYPSIFSYESSIHAVGDYQGLPLRMVDWSSKEPEGTSIEVYFRQSSDNVNFDSLSWEKITHGQQEFGYESGKYFQYKAVLKTNEPAETPRLTKITFTFNLNPTEPTLLSPENNTWIGDSEPTLSWDFVDPDTTDYQSAFEVSMAQDDTFSMIVYNSNIVEDLFNSHKIENSLNDGIYYWQVRLRDNYGSWSPWSEYFILKIDTEQPTVPKIDCLSHPLESVWYRNDRVRFDWYESTDISGIGGYSYILDSSPDAEPSNNITMTTEEFERKHNSVDFAGLAIFDNAPDGVLYFHLKAVDTLGTWSNIATRMVRIDTQASEVIDLTPKAVSVGSTFNFKFTLNDTHSGISLATITWKYSSELDFRFEELILNSSGYYILSHSMGLTNDQFIEYSIEITDQSEPENKMLYPPSGYKRIDIIDNDPPVITDVVYNEIQNRFKDMPITVKASDNIGVSDAKIFFNDGSTGKTMNKDGEGSFSIIIDRVELSTLGDYGAEESIFFKVMVWDSKGNNATSPKSGNYEIALRDVDDTPEPEKRDTEEKGLSNEFIVSLVSLIIVIIIVALILFIFIRKQSEKIGEDRHKLRVAISDAQGIPGGAAVQPGDQIQPAPSQPPLPGTAGYDAGSTYPAPAGAAAPTPMPSAQGEVAGYLPEARGPQAEIPPGDQEAQSYQQAGLMVGPAAAQPGVKAPTEGPQVTTEQDTTTPTGPKTDGVEVAKGVFVSLPGETKSKTKIPRKR
jgi:N-acetylneuraminic acid mutarotase